MRKEISKTPEKWVIVELPNNNFKVFGTWAGGYLDEDKWSLNSGIKEVDQDEDYYYFTGYSGSCYKCHKKSYGTANTYGLTVLESIVEKGKGLVEVREDKKDWEEFFNNLKVKKIFETLSHDFDVYGDDPISYLLDAGEFRIGWIDFDSGKYEIPTELWCEEKEDFIPISEGQQDVLYSMLYDLSQDDLKTFRESKADTYDVSKEQGLYGSGY